VRPWGARVEAPAQKRAWRALALVGRALVRQQHQLERSPVVARQHEDRLVAALLERSEEALRQGGGQAARVGVGRQQQHLEEAVVGLGQHLERPPAQLHRHMIGPIEGARPVARFLLGLVAEGGEEASQGGRICECGEEIGGERGHRYSRVL
jgi:hypothetical protein